MLEGHRRIISMVSIIVPLLLFFTMIGCNKPSMNDSEHRTMVESNIGVTFPSSAIWVNSKYDFGHGFGDLFYCKFKAPKKDVLNMFSGLNIKWSSKSRDRDFLLYSTLKWFDANKVKSFRCGTLPTPGSVLNILYEDIPTDLDTDVVLVYINWFEK